MQLSAAEITGWIGAYLWALFRIAALMTALPVFGSQLTPMRIRLLLSLVLTLVIVPTIEQVPAVDPLSVDALLIILQQVLIGLAMGFALQLVYGVFTLAGQVVAMQMGLGFAAMVDPQSGGHVPVVSQFYLILVTLTFLALNGHLVMIEVLAESFRTLPIGAAGLGADGLWTLVAWGTQMFGGAVLIALPAIAALLLVNLSFGVMTRAAPQLNIFAVGFPITLMMGFAIMLVALPAVISQIGDQLGLGFDLIRQMGLFGR